MAAPIGFSNCVVCTILFWISFSRANFFLSCNGTQCVHIDLNNSYAREIAVKPLENRERKLCILCYPGENKTWYRLWINPKIQIETSSPETQVDVYYGQNVTEVVERSRSNSYFSWPAFSMLKSEHAFEPFNSSCIGLASTERYTIYFNVKNPELRFVLYTVCGLLIFFWASSWSRNIVLQYSTGVSLGILGSILIAVFIVSRFLPQTLHDDQDANRKTKHKHTKASQLGSGNHYRKLKNVGYLIMVASTSASMYLYRWFTVYFHDILVNHWQILLGYVLVAGLLSFAAVYRYGPVTDYRTLNLVKWSLQCLGLVLVYQGTQISEMSIAIIVIALGVYHVPIGFFLLWLKKMRYRYFPPKIQLLTEEEFYWEGERETKKALEELRQFCQSPECNPWRTVSHLQSPNRFASFIEGKSHVTDEEIIDHDNTAERFPLDLSDDSDDSEPSSRLMAR